MTTLSLHADRATLLPAQRRARAVVRFVDRLKKRAEHRHRSLDLDALPDRLRMDIGLPPLGERPSRIVPPIGFGRL